MLKNKKPGVSIVETLLVLAISGALFVVVIGVFSNQKKSSADTAARQVMADIAKVRNQAQQGQGPSDAAEETALAGNEIFGQAIEFGEDKMIIHKLKQNPVSKTISDYGTYEIEMPYELQWNIYPQVQCSESSFNSCNKNSINTNWLPLPNAIAQSTYLVFRNGSAQGYLLSNTTQRDYDYRIFSNYSAATNNQPYLRLAFGVPSTIGDRQRRMEGAINRYFAVFDLKIPNNQELVVIK